MLVEYHKDCDGNLILDEENKPIPLEVCICAAWNANECCCGAWMRKDYYGWDDEI